MTFEAWIASRRVTDTPRGDFVQDYRRAPKPDGAQSWVALQWYLMSRGAVPSAIKAARSVWREFERAQAA